MASHSMGEQMIWLTPIAKSAAPLPLPPPPPPPLAPNYLLEKSPTYTLVNGTCSVFGLSLVGLVDGTCSVFGLSLVRLVDGTCFVFGQSLVGLVDGTCSVFGLSLVGLVDGNCSVFGLSLLLDELLNAQFISVFVGPVGWEWETTEWETTLIRICIL